MTTFRSAFNPPRAFAFCAVLSLAACDSAPGPLGNMFGGDKPAEGVTETLPRPQPDARGVITYANYQVIVAREGDDISSIAARVGLEPSELARHNGLPGGYRPRTGEVLALPRDVGGTPATYGGVAASGSPTASGAAPADAGALWSSDIAATAIDTAETAPQGANPFANGQSTTVIDPKRHRVVRGETAFSIARTHGVSVQALGEWNGLGPDYALRDGQELLIPVSDFKPVEREVASLNPPGTPTPIAPPPSAAAPLPEDQNVADVVRPASPNLGTERTEASLSPNSPEPTPAPAPTSAPIATAAFGAPVAGARVLRPYDPTGPNKNEGIDFAAAAGAPVLAAADGEVALISESLGGLGTIVLIRHDGNLMSVYGRVTDVSLSKGAPVRRGQPIGVVAPGEEPNVHFEIRSGTDAVDPGPYLNL